MKLPKRYIEQCYFEITLLQCLIWYVNDNLVEIYLESQKSEEEAKFERWLLESFYWLNAMMELLRSIFQQT